MPRKAKATTTKPKAPPKVTKPVTPNTIDELLGIVRILTAHRIYYTLANPTHSQMAIHIHQADLVKTQELLPTLFPKINKSGDWGQTVTFRLSGAPDKLRI